MKALTKVTCRRCGGSGKFSFHLVKGTVCFGCDGTGSQMVDLVKEQAKKSAAEKRQAAQQAKRDRVIAATAAVLCEMNSAFDNAFDTSTTLGVHLLNQAVARKFGKSIWVIRDERLAA